MAFDSDEAMQKKWKAFCRKIDTKTLTYADASYKLKSVGKWPKDTYYLKVYTDTEKSSGWYILRWK